MKCPEATSEDDRLGNTLWYINLIPLQESATPDPNAKAQLDLLAKLIGGNNRTGNKADIRLNLFKNDKEEE